MRRSRAGFTLVEVMVASTLALIVLTLVIELFIPALRAWSDGQRRSEVGQRLLVTTTWLGEDVVRASPGSIRLTDDAALVMKCAKGQTTDHTNPFSLFVAYWMEKGEIWRATQDLADPDAEMTTTQLADLKGLADKRRVASNVTAFEITIPQPWRVQMHLALDKEGRTGEIETAYSSIYAPLDLAIAAENEKGTTQP